LPRGAALFNPLPARSLAENGRVGELSVARILVTGAGGFIGRALCPALAARGHRVVAGLRRRRGPGAPPIEGAETWTSARMQPGGKKGWALTFRRAGAIWGGWIDANRNFTIPRLTTPGYTVVNVAGSYVINQNVTAFARVDNLFDKRYQNPTGFDRPGFGAYAGIRHANR